MTKEATGVQSQASSRDTSMDRNAWHEPRKTRAMTLSRQFAATATLSGLALTLNGCAVIGGIFKAGIWVGVLAVVVVGALIAWGIRALTR